MRWGPRRSPASSSCSELPCLFALVWYQEVLERPLRGSVYSWLGLSGAAGLDDVPGLSEDAPVGVDASGRRGNPEAPTPAAAAAFFDRMRILPSLSRSHARLMIRWAPCSMSTISVSIRVTKKL